MMINNIIEKIKDELRKNMNFPIYPLMFQGLYEILSLKYLCDNNVLKYNDIMKEHDLSTLKVNDKKLVFSLNINYKKLLHEIEYENLEDMIYEYINSDKEVYNKLSLSDERRLAFLDATIVNASYYDLEGKTTYIFKDECESSIYLIFQFFDKVLNLKNDYKHIDEVNLDDYCEIHFYRMRLKYGTLNLDKKIFEEINYYVSKGLKVILYTNYSRINNYKNGNCTLRYLKNIIFLPNNKSILIYDKKENDEISIINYTVENNLEKLKKIIINNRKVKDILIKIKINDIFNNNCRLGFRLYQLEYENKNKTINEIVDYNTRLIKRLERINEVVEKEINFLINK